MTPDGFNFLTPDDRLEMAEAERRALIDANAADLDADRALDWRTCVAQALADEGVQYRWYPERGVSVVRRNEPDAERLTVPDDYLDALCEQGTAPRAVACALKAITYDTRLRGWGDDDDV